jgi:hypothetical protein
MRTGTYRRRDGPRSGLTGASRAVLGHLAHPGPAHHRRGGMGWQERHPEQSRADAEAATLAYVAAIPAWRDHSRVAGRE